MPKHIPKENLFPSKLNEILQNKEYESIIKWGQRKNSIQVRDLKSFQQRILPQHFRHNNFQSFIRQMNLYGFKKNRNSEIQIFVNAELKNGKQLTELESRNQKKKKKINRGCRRSFKSEIIAKKTQLPINVAENLGETLKKEVQQQNLQNLNENQLSYPIAQANLTQYYWSMDPQIFNFLNWQQYQLMQNYIAAYSNLNQS